MKYIAIINSDDELSENDIKDLKGTIFIGNENAPYCFEIESVTKAPEEIFKNNIRSMEIKA